MFSEQHVFDIGFSEFFGEGKLNVLYLRAKGFQFGKCRGASKASSGSQECGVSDRFEVCLWKTGQKSDPLSVFQIHVEAQAARDINGLKLLGRHARFVQKRFDTG